ncbi:hypothetical protein ABBQ38_007305 [Trebouxia sp. C0009 RCD-2024]
MEGISLSWILRIQELEIILRAKQQELQVQAGRLSEAEASLGQASGQQENLQKQALALQLQKAQLQCVVSELEMEVHRHQMSDSTEDTCNNLCGQTRLDYTVQQKQRIAAKMKQEQKEMQEFSSLMKSMLHDNKDIIRDHQDKIAQENKQTEQTQCELALLQESVAHMQQQQNSLQSLLAQQDQCLTQRQREVSDTATHLAQLRQSQQQERQQAQVQANLHNGCPCNSSSCLQTSMRSRYCE